MRRMLCFVGIHDWRFWEGKKRSGYEQIRRTCNRCLAHQYGWKRFGHQEPAFGFTDDRSAWSANGVPP